MAPPRTFNAPRGTIRGTTSQNHVRFTIRTVPLPKDILEFILDNIAPLKLLQLEGDSGRSHIPADGDVEFDVHDDMFRRPSVKPEQFWDALTEKCNLSGGQWEGLTDKIWAFGPQKAGGCVLVDARNTSTPQSSVP
jgi:ribosome assembly protein 1